MNFFVRPDSQAAPSQAGNRPMQNYTPQTSNPFSSSVTNPVSRTPGPNIFASSGYQNSFPSGTSVPNPLSSTFAPTSVPGNFTSTPRNPFSSTSPGIPSTSQNPFNGYSISNPSPFAQNGPNYTSSLTPGAYSSNPGQNPFNSGGNPLNYSGLTGLNPANSALSTGFFVNSGQGSGQNFINTTSGPNTSFFTNPANLSSGNNFAGNTGTPGTSFFANPTQFTGQNIMNSSHFHASPSAQFDEPGAWKYKKIETLTESFKAFFYNTQKDIDKIDESLKHGHSTLKHVDDILIKVSEKCRHVLSYTKKVLSLQKRIKISLEIKQNFEDKVARYIKDFIRICDHCSAADQYHQIDAPAAFLHDFLEMCGQRLEDMEEHILTIEEMIKNECEIETISMLVQTISLMQERFKIVSAITYDLHARVSKLYDGVSSQYKGFNTFTPFVDPSQILDARAEINSLKENTPPSIMKSSNIRDVISGRSFFMNK